jgi:hypothetical protein
MTMPPSGDQPAYVDPVTGQPLFIDPATGQLAYTDPTAAATPAQPAGYPPIPPYPATAPAYPGYAPPTTAYPTGDPAVSGVPAGGYPPAGYPAGGYAAPTYQPSPYGYPAYGYPMMPPMQQKTNSMAITGMVLSIVGFSLLFCYGLGGLLGLPGAIVSHIARRRVRARNEAGAGMALAGIIVGWITVAFGIVAVIAWIYFFTHVYSDPTINQ